MQVDGALVDGAVRGIGVHHPDHLPGGAFDDLDGPGGGGAQADVVGGPVGTGPEPGAAAVPQHLPGSKVPGQRQRHRTEPALIRGRERLLLGGSGQVRSEDV